MIIREVKKGGILSTKILRSKITLYRPKTLYSLFFPQIFTITIVVRRSVTFEKGWYTRPLKINQTLLSEDAPKKPWDLGKNYFIEKVTPTSLL